MKPIMVVGGTRPEVIKLVPVMSSLRSLGVDYFFVWSGQHYDYELSRIFFEEFRLRRPDEDLQIGSGSHAQQTSRIMIRLERIIGGRLPAMVVAVGDTNTVLASSITSAKCCVPFGHVEAGLRAWNITMPEEVNRKVADAIATTHFAPTNLAVSNLMFEGTSRSSVYLTGNTIVDAVYSYRKLLEKQESEVLARFGLSRRKYLLVTIHRAENTNSAKRIASIMTAIEKLSHEYTIVFPIHPRTELRVEELGLDGCLENVIVTKPVGYLEFLGLLASCRTVLTDSGGVQEEAFILKVPTVTIRYNTERPETLMHHLNKLAGADTESIMRLTSEQAKYTDKARRLRFKNPLGEGDAGRKIARVLEGVSRKPIPIKEPDLRGISVLAYAPDSMHKLRENRARR